MQDTGGISNEEVSISVFGRLEESLEKNRLGFLEQNAHPSCLFKRLVGFQYVLHDIVSARHADESRRQAGRPTTDRDLAEVAVLDILEQNKLYLCSALDTLARGALHASGSLARSAYESVPKCFYIMARPRTVKKFMLSEMYPVWRTSNPIAEQPCPIKAFLESQETREFLGKDRITAAEFKKFRKTHKIKDMREKVYDGKALDIQDHMYAVLSFSSHADMLRSFTSVPGSGLSERLMKTIADLSFLNLFLTVNSQSRLLDGREFRQSKEFMRKALQDLGPQSGLTDMYPSKGEYGDGLAVTIESLS